MTFKALLVDQVFRPPPLVPPGGLGERGRRKNRGTRYLFWCNDALLRGGAHDLALAADWLVVEHMILLVAGVGYHAQATRYRTPTIISKAKVC